MTKLEELKRAIWAALRDKFFCTCGNDATNEQFPITLADVLRAMDLLLNPEDNWIVCTHGRFEKLKDPTGTYPTWDLTKDLDGQAPDLWDFLHAIIVRK